MDFLEATEQTRSGQPLLSLWLLLSVVPEFRGELQDVALGPGGQEREDVTQVGPWFDGVQLTACNETGGDGVTLGTIVTSRKVPVRAPPALTLISEANSFAVSPLSRQRSTRFAHSVGVVLAICMHLSA
jgi:hypothetical protein